MNVGFGVTALSNGLVGSGIDGIGHYTYELYKALQSFPSVNLTTYSYGVSVNKDILNTSTYQFNKYSHELVKSFVFPSSRVKSQLGETKVDIIHATDHIIPLVQDVPLVATLMDTIPLSHPEWCNQTILWRMKVNLWKKIAQRADHILTISEYSKSEIIRYFEIESERISVVGLGVEQRFFSSIQEQERKRVLEKYNISGNYVINIGTLQPRKNIESILDAMRTLPAHIRKTHKLVIVGRYGWGCESQVQELKKAEREGWCRWLSYVSDTDLRALLQSASLMVFPSLCEGFGLPTLEAFASKVPVVASNTSSIPEVAGDSALLVDPLNSSDIASAISTIIEDKELSDKLTQKGYEHAKEMTWQRCAEGTIEVYKKVIGYDN